MELPVHDNQGNVLETIQFDETCLGKFVNRQLLHDAIVMYEANRRQGTVCTKGVRDVAGTTRKPFRQKGTGRARMGTRRRVGNRGGAIAHGPRPRDYSLNMPRRERRLATKSALLGKFRDGEVVVVDGLSFDQPKTGRMATVLKNLKVDNGCLVIVKANDGTLWKSVRNIPKTDLSPLSDLNAYSVLLRKNLLITKEALQAIGEEMK